MEWGRGGGQSRALYECAVQNNKLVQAMNFGSFIVFFVIEILKLFESSLNVANKHRRGAPRSVFFLCETDHYVHSRNFESPFSDHLR